ncbi:hypothetical protein GO755_39315 [Spirosoma sp. HMF4905]|uniref:Uncharacterized protein n=1 Tax=Spirosoma arboris TaxID=2682092 RepID=A0A7K1SQQ2_9BACT|nr:hypothetical protein [Spirosoma arboris]MVM36128.1 hypothetical protein [Spirosoma arboris]
MIKTYTLSLFADYFQVFIYDACLDWSTVRIEADWWTEQDSIDMFASKENGRLIVMETFRNFNVPIEVAVLETEPPIHSLDKWDQSVECSIRTQSSGILIAELANEGQNGLLIEGAGPNWRLRIYYGGQNTIDRMGIEGKDHYLIELWPVESISSAVIIKQRHLD